MSEKAPTDTQKQAKVDVARVLNTFFNPLAFDRTLAPAGASPTRKALIHAGGLGIGYGGLAIVLRKLHKLKELETLGINSEISSDRKSYSEGKYPTFSIDPDEQDLEEEKELETRLLGEGDKTAADDGSFSSGVAGFTGKALHDITSGKHDPAHLALATAAVFAASAGGWRLADYLEDTSRRDKLDKSIAETRNKLDKMIYDEYARVKGMGKQAAISAEEVEGTRPSIPRMMTDPRRYPDAIANFWWLWATFAFAFSYKAMRTYSDKQDPARSRMKDLKKVLGSRSKLKEAPVLLDASELPEMPGKSEEGAVQRTGRPALPSGSANVSRLPKSEPSAIPPELGISESKDLYTELMGA